jgi:hypothetical protein
MYHNERGYEGLTNVWLTPRWLTEKLGPFECDPCAADPRPWDIGTDQNITEAQDGLVTPWQGFAYVNPPYGPHVGKWADLLANHEPGGILLIFARMETQAVQRALLRCDAVYFLSRRLTFLEGTPPHNPAKGSGGAPSMLIAFGELAVGRISRFKRGDGSGVKFVRDDVWREW